MTDLPFEPPKFHLAPGLLALKERLPALIETIDRGLRYPAAPSFPNANTLGVLASKLVHMEAWTGQLVSLVSTHLAPVAGGAMSSNRKGSSGRSRNCGISSS